MTKILITGSLGFILSNFIRGAIYTKKPWQIVGVDRANAVNSLHYAFINKKVSNYIADVTDPHVMQRIMDYEQPNIVLHGAALTSVDEALTKQQDYIRTNVLGTQVVLDAAARSKVEKFIYLSTDEVYGHLETEDSPSWSEDSVIAPRNTYSASKAAGEHLVRAYGISHGLCYNVIRMANNYGERQGTNKLIPRSIGLALKNYPVQLYGKGQQMRDWLHVQDSFEGISTIIEKGSQGETYNLGAGQEFSNLEVAQLLSKAMGKEMRVEFVPDRVGHDYRYSLNSDKARKLGWSPQIKFKDGIQRTVEWFQLNQHWFN